jgi:glycerol uptake facilitator-like aquaporin
MTIVDMNDQKSQELREIKIAKKIETIHEKSNIFYIKNEHVRELLSEALSTFVLISFGIAANAQSVLGKSSGFGLTFAVQIAWGIAVMMGILVGGKVSGAHMNPCVTVAMVILGKLRALKLVFYVIGQAIGAFLGSLLVYIVYLDALNHYDGGKREVINGTAG